MLDSSFRWNDEAFKRDQYRPAAVIARRLVVHRLRTTITNMAGMSWLARRS